MKQSFILSIIVLIILSVTSCSQQNKPNSEKSEVSESEETSKPKNLEASLERDPRKIGPEKSKDQYQIEENILKINTAKDPLYGFWVGAFGKNKINIAIAYTDYDSIYGHSVCAGNFRPIKGTIKETEDQIYSINMVEPGDNKYDGEFNFTIDVNKQDLTGTWSPYKKTTSDKTYTLQKRVYIYNPNFGEHSFASTEWMEVPDVENLLPEQIELIRNEIYARHGYSFQNLKIRRIFDSKDWYIPISIDIRDRLTDLEAHNIDLMYNYEEYYDDYYDSYGR